MASRAEPLLPVYALQGEDWPKVDRAVARLVGRVAREGGGEPERFDAKDAPIDDVVAALQTLSFGGLQAVIVSGADAWRAAEADTLVAYLEDPNPTSVLTLVSTGALPQRLQQVVERVGDVRRWGPTKSTPKERRRWLEGHFAQEVERLGGHVSPSLARHVVDRACGEPSDAQRTGLSALMLTHEAEKLVAYAGGAPIDKAMVADVTPEHPEARVYELADALVAGECAAGLRSARRPGHRRRPYRADRDRGRPRAALSRPRARAGARSGGQRGGGQRGDRHEGIPGSEGGRAVRDASGRRAARAVARLARLEIEMRVSAQRELGGALFVLESAARDLVAIARGAALV